MIEKQAQNISLSTQFVWGKIQFYRPTLKRQLPTGKYHCKVQIDKHYQIKLSFLIHDNVLGENISYKLVIAQTPGGKIEQL